MLTAEHLEIGAHSLTAVLSVWLGLTLLTRSSSPPARVFGVLCLALVAWSTSIIVQHLTTSVAVLPIGHGVEELSAALIVPTTAYFSLVIATEGRPSRHRLRLLAVAYALNLAFALPGALDRSAPIAISPPQLAIGPIPAALLGSAWIATRLVTLAGGAGWLLGAYRRTRPDDPRRRQLRVTLATVAVGAIGGSIRVLNVVGETPAWIGVSLVTLAMVLSASVVFSSGLFFAPDVASRAFWRSLALGLGLFVLVGVLLAVDAASRTLLGLDVPLLTIIAVVIAVASFEPVSSWVQGRIHGGSGPAIARARLMTALGQRNMAAQAADAGVQPALTRVIQALDLAGAVVIRPDGSIAAAEGSTPDPATAPAISLVVRDEVVGELRLGDPRSGVPLTAGDHELLRLSAAYVAAALRTGRREGEQAEALTGLSNELAEVESTALRLYEALVGRSEGPAGLHVFALGPLRVERDSTPIERWGGEKAGTRQAEALFAFLFDRGERGLAKDEALELIWPDVDVERADLAFHRTLGGLRRTLDPEGTSGKHGIRFHNDRYRLDPTVVGWSDVERFLARLDAARGAADQATHVRLLEEARAMYRGEYLDDCPFYGDSVYVEDRRAALRGRSVDLLVALGELYETAGDRVSAAAAYREAVASAADDCPPATAGLSRLAAV
jgi:hypothetical protein